MDIMRYVPVDEARKRLGVKRQRVHDLVAEGKLPGSVNWYGVYAIPVQSIADRLLLLKARRDQGMTNEQHSRRAAALTAMKERQEGVRP